MKIPGLPDGIEAVAWGSAVAGEYVADHTSIRKAEEGRCILGLIVKPADGYDFIFDAPTAAYTPVRKYKEPQGWAVTFSFANSKEAGIIDRLKGLAGFVSAEPLYFYRAGSRNAMRKRP